MASTSRLVLSSKASTTTVTGDAQSLQGNCGSFIGWLNVSVQGGASSATAKIQHSPDGTNWIDLCTFAAVTNTTGVQAVHQGDAGFLKQQVFPSVRAVVTMAGVTPTATVEVSLWFDPLRG
jgi:hypothetical protein